jgi:hypothetical protein
MVQDEQILSSSESGLRFLTDRHFSVRKWSRLLMYHRHRLPIVVNMGSGLGQSLFWRVTQEDWPASSNNNFPLCLTWGMVRFGGWCRTVTSFGNGPDNHSLGRIHSLQVALCLVPKEWSRFNNQGQTFLRANSFSPGYTLFSVGGMAQGGEWSKLRKSGQLFFLA